jgi:soluble lytic murein transglycosylase
LAFVAYNAGLRRAEEWIGQYGDPRSRKVDPIDWIECIPIMETTCQTLLIEADLRRAS